MPVKKSKPAPKHQQHSQHANHLEAHQELPPGRPVQGGVLAHFTAQPERVRGVQEAENLAQGPSKRGIAPGTTITTTTTAAVVWVTRVIDPGVGREFVPPATELWHRGLQGGLLHPRNEENRRRRSNWRDGKRRLVKSASSRTRWHWAKFDEQRLSTIIWRSIDLIERGAAGGRRDHQREHAVEVWSGGLRGGLLNRKESSLRCVFAPGAIVDPWGALSADPWWADAEWVLRTMHDTPDFSQLRGGPGGGFLIYMKL